MFLLLDLSLNLLLFQLHNILLRNVQFFKLFNLLLLKFLQQSCFLLVHLLGLLILNLSLLSFLLRLLALIKNLLFQLQSVFLQQLFSLMFKLLLKFSDFSLLTDSCLKLGLLSSGLFFEHFLFFHLLLCSRDF